MADQRMQPPIKQPSPKRPRKFQLKMKLNPKRLVLWFIIFLLFAPFIISLFAAGTMEDEIPLSQAISDIREGFVKEVEVDGERLNLTYSDDEQRVSRKEGTETLVEILNSSGIDPESLDVTVKDQSFSRIWLELLGTFLPLVLMGLFFLFLSLALLFFFDKSFSQTISAGKVPVDITAEKMTYDKEADKYLTKPKHKLKNIIY